MEITVSSWKRRSPFCHQVSLKAQTLVCFDLLAFSSCFATAFITQQFTSKVSNTLKYFDEPIHRISLLRSELNFLVWPIIEKLYPVSGPNPVLNITPIIDSTNVTLEWPRPEGRIETYVIRWWPVENPQDIRSKNVTESNDVTSVLFEENSVQRVLVSDLMPGVQYSFVIYTVSYNLFSDITNLTTRTSKSYYSFVLAAIPV